jgi:N-acetylmuramoyl-L-alanine amidase
MRAKGASIQQLLLGMALLGAVCWNLAHAGELRGLDLSSGPTGTRAELRMDSEAGYQLITLASPDRLVVDLPGSSARRGLALPAATGVVRGVRSGQPTRGTTRVVFDLANPVTAIHPHYEPGPDGPRLVLEWPDDGNFAAALLTQGSVTPNPAAEPPPAGTTPSTGTPAPAAVAASAAGSVPAPAPPAQTSAAVPASPTRAPVKTMQDVMRRNGLRPLVIAIDAGHGGQDPGAHGPGGTREKMVTLAIAKELARQVNATPGMKAYLTRDTDVFIPLTQRYQKARAAKADLFVSIHADSSPSPEACGSSVFVLSQRGASSQAARWLASQENAADLVGGVKLQDKDDTLASVLLDLSQSATMKASEDMAGQVLVGLKQLGKTHKHEIERANFVVLRSPDVPSMLVETAFISNPDEERRLNDPVQQSQLAHAVLNGVTAYFSRQPPPGTLYAARADAAGSGLPGGGSP